MPTSIESRPADQLSLTTAEKQQLAEDTDTVRKGILAFVQVGKALQRIRDGRLYRLSHATFEAFCEAEFKFSKRHANRLIEGAKTSDALVQGTNWSQSGPPVLPTNEGQVRPLGKVPTEQRAAVWEKVVDTAPIDATGKPNITAKHVASVVEECWEPGMASLKPRVDHAEASDWSDNLYQLKRRWKKCSKKDKAAFLKSVDAPDPSKPFDADKRGEKLRDWLRHELEQWPKEHLREAAHWVTQIITKEFKKQIADSHEMNDARSEVRGGQGK